MAMVLLPVGKIVYVCDDVSDAILLAAFDDESRPSSFPATPGARPAGRLRPDGSRGPATDPIALVAIDSDAASDRAGNPQAACERPLLAFDIGLFDVKTASFLVVYSAGTPLDASKTRTVSISASPAGPPITVLKLYVRSPADLHWAPYLTLQWPHDIQGRQLTFRFTDPTDPRSLVIGCDSFQGLATSGITPPDAAGLPS